MRLAQILNLERERRCVTDLYCENSGQDVRGHFALSSAGYDKPTVTVFRGPQYDRCQADAENDPIMRGSYNLET
jgi:hypothetical protein